MISSRDVASLIGSIAYDANGEQLGTVDDVSVDPLTRTPEWAVILSPLTHVARFVPLLEAELTRAGLQVPYDKQLLVEAPIVPAEDALTEDEEQRLYAYYGLGSPRADTGRPPAVSLGAPPEPQQQQEQREQEPWAGEADAGTVATRPDEHTAPGPGVELRDGGTAGAEGQRDRRSSSEPRTRHRQRPVTSPPGCPSARM